MNLIKIVNYNNRINYYDSVFYNMALNKKVGLEIIKKLDFNLKLKLKFLPDFRNYRVSLVII